MVLLCKKWKKNSPLILIPPFIDEVTETRNMDLLKGTFLTRDPDSTIIRARR